MQGPRGDAWSARRGGKKRLISSVGPSVTRNPGLRLLRAVHPRRQQLINDSNFDPKRAGIGGLGGEGLTAPRGLPGAKLWARLYRDPAVACNG